MMIGENSGLSQTRSGAQTMGQLINRSMGSSNTGPTFKRLQFAGSRASPIVIHSNNGLTEGQW